MANNFDINIRARGADEAAREIKKIPAAAQVAARAINGSAKQSGAALKGIGTGAGVATKHVAAIGPAGSTSLGKLVTSARSAETAIGGLSTRAGGLKTVLGGVAASVAGMGLSQLSSNLIATGLEAANAEKKLSAMLSVRGQSHLKGEIIGLSEQMQKLTGQSAETFQEAASHLLSFGLNVSQIKKILPGMSGQADTMGQSLVSVADGFGRAFSSGNVGALTRSGLVLSAADKAAIGLAKSTGEAAGQTELFKRVLSSYEQYAVKAGAGTDAAAKTINRFGEASGDAAEAIGIGAANMRAAWMGALTPMVEGLSENHSGLLQNIGAVIEMGGAVGQLAGPLTTGAGLLFEYKQMTNLSRLASIANTGVVAAEGHAAGVAAAEFNALAVAKGRASGAGVGGVAAKGAGFLSASAFGLTGAAALGVGALAVGATAYGATKTVQGVNDRNMSDANLKNRHGALGGLWAAGGRALGNSWIGETLEGGGFGHKRKGDAAEKESAAITARMRASGGKVKVGGAVASQVAGMAITADEGESTPGKDKKAPSVKAAQRKRESELERKAENQRKLNAIMAARSVDLGEVDVEAINDRLATTTDASQRAGLMEIKRRAQRFQRNAKAGATAQTKDKKYADDLAERIAQSEAAIAETIIAEKFATASARLEALRGKDNGRQIDYQLAQLEARNVMELAQLQARHSDSFAEGGGLKIAQIKSQGIIERAGMAFRKGGGALGGAAKGALGKARGPYEAFKSGPNETTYDGKKFFGNAESLGFYGLGGGMQPFGAANMQPLGAGMAPLAGSGRGGNQDIHHKIKVKSQEYINDGKAQRVYFEVEPLVIDNTTSLMANRRR
jgi:hypothetical protein